MQRITFSDYILKFLLKSIRFIFKVQKLAIGLGRLLKSLGRRGGGNGRRVGRSAEGPANNQTPPDLDLHNYWLY
jgi:hypothetical protein